MLQHDFASPPKSLPRPRLRELLARHAQSGYPVIAVPFTGITAPETVAAAMHAGVVVAELRIDSYPDYEVAAVRAEVQKFKDLATLATVRAQHEDPKGCALPEQQRWNLFQEVLPLVDAVDIEWSSQELRAPAIAAARALDKYSIVSFHDFAQTPDLSRLIPVVDGAFASGANIVKIATMVREMRDLQTLAHLLLHALQGQKDAAAARHIIVIGMGERGRISRLSFPALGSCLSFASMGSSTASGQIPYELMRQQLAQLYPAI